MRRARQIVLAPAPGVKPPTILGTSVPAFDGEPAVETWVCWECPSEAGKPHWADSAQTRLASVLCDRCEERLLSKPEPSGSSLQVGRTTTFVQLKGYYSDPEVR
jgi:hypothetical protein